MPFSDGDYQIPSTGSLIFKYRLISNALPSKVKANTKATTSDVSEAIISPSPLTIPQMISTVLGFITSPFPKIGNISKPIVENNRKRGKLSH